MGIYLFIFGRQRNTRTVLEESMTIRELTLTDVSAYRALMLCDLQEHPESFRISVEDAGEPMVPFASSRSDSFILGAWLDDGQLAGAVSFVRETEEKLSHKDCCIECMCVRNPPAEELAEYLSGKS